jgi:hypothetical protein
MMNIEDKLNKLKKENRELRKKLKYSTGLLEGWIMYNKKINYKNSIHYTVKQAMKRLKYYHHDPA